MRWIHPLFFALAASALAPGAGAFQGVLPAGTGAQATASRRVYNFAAADALLQSELANLNGRVAVILSQGAQDIYRFQGGDIDFGSQTPLASVTKTITAGVILALADANLISLDEQLGSTLLTFAMPGIGDASVIDCFGMRHGIEAPWPYERDPAFTLAQSVWMIGTTGSPAFPAGTQLGYSGKGMQCSARIAVMRTGTTWEQTARDWLLDDCGMSNTDYQQFDPNPAVAGGGRSSTDDLLRYTKMILAQGLHGPTRLLSQAAVERMFTNSTRDLPVFGSPFPAQHPLYPYGVEPDYSFGAWVLAENPATQHVEEIMGAGAWGSFIWMDRRRDLTAVFITKLPSGAQAAMTPALGLFAIARAQVDAAQVSALSASPRGNGVQLQWQAPAGTEESQVFGHQSPIRDVFDLRSAQLIHTTSQSQATVPSFPHYAVIASYGHMTNRAIIPGGNATE